MTGEGGVKELQFSCSKTSTTFHLCLCGVFVLKRLSSSRAISFNLLPAFASPRESRPPQFRFPSSRTRSPLDHASVLSEKNLADSRDPHWFTGMMMPFGVIRERWECTKFLAVFRECRGDASEINIFVIRGISQLEAQVTRLTNSYLFYQKAIVFP